MRSKTGIADHARGKIMISKRAFPAVLAFSIIAILAAADIPRPEHPRPDFERTAWLNLNGAWDFDFDPDGVGEQQRWFEPGRHKWSQKIVVPYPWESKLSAIERPDYRGIGWYHCKIAAAAEWKGKRIFLIFGAVDWDTRVWLDGKLLGVFHYGYIPFAFEVTAQLADGQEHDLVLRAEDRVDPETPTGKQTGWYTPSSGIWQTVYLEARGGSYIEGFRAFPDLDAGGARVEVYVIRNPNAGALRLAAVSANNEFERVAVAVGDNARETVSLFIKPAKVQLWSPDSPHLYGLRLQLLSGGEAVDEVGSYFALREVKTGKWGDQDFESVLLNGEPVYIQAALHQSFHPDGIYTYPSDDVIRHDLQFTRDCGLNSLRVHIKVEEPRFYYWADKLGVLIWYDLPNFSRYSDRACRNWEATLRGAIARDFNHPSIFAWILFNETWGLSGRGGYGSDRREWVRSMYELTKQIDPTRLVEDNSPCNYDHVVTDLNTWHFYINDYDRARDHIADAVNNTFPGSSWNYVAGETQRGRPLLNSEYGGISAVLGDQDISYCLHYLTNLLRGQPKIQGFVYTELTDIEWEHNGLANYDRSPKEYGYPVFRPTTLADVFNPDFVVLPGPPIRTAKPGETVTVPVSISHYSSREMKSPKLQWWRDGRCLADGTPEWFLTSVAPPPKERTARLKRYAVVQQDPLEIELLEYPGLYCYMIDLRDAADEVVARNWVWFNTVESPTPRVQFSSGGFLLRFDPQPTVSKGTETDLLLRGGMADKFVGYGEGRVEYHVKIPEFIDPKEIKSIRFRAELAAKAGDEKLDWPARKKPVDYPQTDGKKFPSRVVVSINGARLAEWILEDDPADYRGILSHQTGQQGAYGYLKQVGRNMASVPAPKKRQPAGDGSPNYPRVVWPRLPEAAKEAIERDRRILVTLDYGPIEGKPSGGLTVFGETNGAYPVEPTLFLTMNKSVGIPEDYDVNAPLVERKRPRVRALLPTVGFGETKWKFTTEKPPNDWTAPGFDDSAWNTGRHGFGTPGTPNTRIGTRWDTDDIWLRWKGEFRPLPAKAPIWIDYYHDEAMQVFVNGKPLLRRRGFITEYSTERLTDDQRALFVEGENTIAVHCNQTSGGQFIDVGFFTRGAP